MEKLDPSLYEHKTTLVNLSSSLLAHYGVTPFHSTIPEVDALMKGHDKIAFFLFDGAGEAILNGYPRTTRFMREHRFLSIHSVNPATTVACTTALLTGRYPSETAWLGWSLYVPGYEDPIDVFPNNDSLTGEPMKESAILSHAAPITYIDDLLKAHGVKAKLDLEAPLWDGKGPHTLKELRQQAHSYFQAGGQFLYMYWTEPDHTIHHHGTSSWALHKILHSINHTVKKLVKENPDVLIFTLADHGLINVQYRDLAAFPKLEGSFRKPMALEGRTAAFFIKPGEEMTFESEFNREFADNFVLIKSEEARKMGYFGEGEEHPLTAGMLGDYLAIATGKQILVDSKTHHDFSVHEGHHAGASKEEREVLLAAYNV